jgi:murein DD-endopeptidase MepM/ murein hydrolase activator NlpD
MLPDKIFPELRHRRWGYVNFGIAALGVIKEPNPLLDPDCCTVWKQQIHDGTGIDFSHGGYLEDRNHMWRGSYLQPAGAIHLGIDFTVPEGTEVHLPTDMILHSATTDPDQNGGWGGKAVFKLPDGLFVIFGHLELNGILVTSQRQQYMAGDRIGTIASANWNGGWDPHLHVQIVGPGRNPELVDGYSHLYETIRQDFPDPSIVLSSIP